MTTDEIDNHFRVAVGNSFGTRPRHNTVQLIVPFTFHDGDGLVVHVRPQDGDAVEITDLAHTLMHFDYHSDASRLEDGARGAQFDGITSRHTIENRDGELVRLSTRRSMIEDVLDYVQGLLEVGSLRNLDREIVSSTFREDLHNLLTGQFPTIIAGYVNEDRDPSEDYVVPYLLNGVSRPIAIFDIANDLNASEALVIAGKHGEWTPRLHTVAIERSQEDDLKRKTVAWLSDAMGKQFSSLEGNQEAIVKHLLDEHAVARELDSRRGND